MSSENPPKTQIVLLGTGTPNADPDRMGSSVAIVVGDNAYLVDFGPGVVRRASAAHMNGIAALDMPNLHRAFLTHHHADHTMGYADLILTPWILGRTEPLKVYGPPGTQTMTDHIIAAYQADIDQRLNGLEPANLTGYKVQVQEIEPGLIYEDDLIEVHAFAVQHGSWPAYGYRFVTPTRTIVLSGDTSPFEGLVEHYMGCDTLIHEVYPVAGFAQIPPEWQRYHAAFHTSTHQLAQIAQQVRPDHLILYHQLFWGCSEDDLVAEIKEHYDGEVVSGRDLDIF